MLKKTAWGALAQKCGLQYGRKPRPRVFGQHGKAKASLRTFRNKRRGKQYFNGNETPRRADAANAGRRGAQ